MTQAKRILIVDDEPKILFVLCHTLACFGSECQIDTCSRGLEALETARKTRYDLLITDLRMPDLDGIALTKAIKALHDAPTVIWMTAYDCRATAQDAERLGVHRCLDKPLELADIRHAVREALWGTCQEGEKELVTHL